MKRRGFLWGGAACLALPPHLALGQGQDPERSLIETARKAATRPYRPDRTPLSAPFDGASYDSYRGIRTRPGLSGDLALGPEFRADMLPQGWLFREPVTIDLPGHDTRFSPSLYDFDNRYFGADAAGQDAGSMGFSGLRLRHRLNAPDTWDDVLVLQGASYFRALAKDTVYGLSARALSLGTGGPTPEEFPRFTRIVVFGTQDGLRFGCLVDSPRASAALIATLHPGPRTVLDCALHLFPRVPLEDVGIAPLTSMFQHNDIGPARIDDFRPAVHDSDVLVVDNGAGERLWRPLANPANVQMSAFADRGPRGFGLVQTPTDFARFRDQEGAYHRRPSAWVAPKGDWGAGAVMLLEIPTENEFADNIVAFWRPRDRLEPGAHRFDYRLDVTAPGPDPLPPRPEPFWPARSASGVEPNTGNARLFVIDFHTSGPLPDMIGADLDIGASQGTVSGQALYPLEARPGTWRASFLFTPKAGQEVAELRLRLRGQDGTPLAPVWLHRWTRTAQGGV
ncbi:glucan biosynthesis protein [Roseibaca sp. V10]|uniref:Glucan biosynthesis protein n=1 Tax=Roseinatronobacter domitianus TaxID=2940293 RepID=A0ABT0M046_9RHOB|nr:glucan biosynthesis protein [Roseibaca domitiana]MCL1628236.1 glucan biosynthesis protein [Roseibaca domitiana]